MDIRVKMQGNGELERAIKRIEAAKAELSVAIEQLGRACYSLGIQFEEGTEDEAADAANTDGSSATL